MKKIVVLICIYFLVRERVNCASSSTPAITTTGSKQSNPHTSSAVKPSAVTSTTTSSPEPSVKPSGLPYYTSIEDFKDDQKTSYNDVSLEYDANNVQEDSVTIDVNQKEMWIAVAKINEPGEAEIRNRFMIHVRQNERVLTPECDGGIVGAEIQFIYDQGSCGFSYAWNADKNKVLYTIFSGYNKTFHDALLIGNQREISFEWIKGNGTDNKVEVQSTGGKASWSTNVACFPTYPKDDIIKNNPELSVPFAMWIKTGAEKCGMAIEMRNGYVLLKGVPERQPVRNPSTTTSSTTTPSHTSSKTATPSITSPISPSTSHAPSPTSHSSTVSSVHTTSHPPSTTVKSVNKRDYWILIGIGAGLLVLIIILLIINICVCQRNRGLAKNE